MVGVAKHIQIVQSNYDEDLADACAGFWRAVADDPLAVVIVEPVFRADDGLKLEVCEVSVFSNYEAAMVHAKALPCHGAVVIPKRVDEPSWGNVAVN